MLTMKLLKSDQWQRVITNNALWPSDLLSATNNALWPSDLLSATFIVAVFTGTLQVLDRVTRGQLLGYELMVGGCVEVIKY